MKKFVYCVLALTVLLGGCKNRNKVDGDGEEMESQDSVTVVQPKLSAEAALQKKLKELPEEPVFDINTSMGTIKVRLFKDTPRHRDNFEKLALNGYFDNLLFHRVIDGFMIQGGDPLTRDTLKIETWGQGGPGYTLPAEMVDADGNPLHRHKKGALAAARRGDLANPYKESSGSQFYLVQNPDNCLHLDGEYTVFGETVAGFNVIDKIAATPADRYDRPVTAVVIYSIRPDEEMNKKDEKTADAE
jgi:cyclophilin family peptidyl-prolyl cis-trans isomerase